MWESKNAFAAAMGMMVILQGLAAAQSEATVEVGPWRGSIYLSPTGSVYCTEEPESSTLYAWRFSRGAAELGMTTGSSYLEDVKFPRVVFAGQYAVVESVFDRRLTNRWSLLVDPAGNHRKGRKDVFLHAVNASGVAVGVDNTGVFHPIRAYLEEGELSYLGISTEAGSALEVNAAGAAVGTCGLGEAVLWTAANELVILGPLPETAAALKPAINDAGVVVFAGLEDQGSKAEPAVMYREPDGTVHNLGPLYLGSGWRAYLSESGVTAWERPSVDPYRQAVAWDPVNGLSEMTPPDEAFGAVYGINAQGQVAGTFTDMSVDPSVRSAFLWSRTEGRIDIPSENVRYTVIDDLGRVAWAENGDTEDRILLRDAEGNIEVLAEGLNLRFGGSIHVALNNLGQVAWRGKDAEGNPIVYLRGPVDTMTDSDGDARSDEVEGKNAAKGPRDSDGDGTPDYLDMDSDNDGLPDAYDPTAYDTQNPTPFPLNAWAVGASLLAFGAARVRRRRNL